MCVSVGVTVQETRISLLVSVKSLLRMQHIAKADALLDLGLLLVLVKTKSG